MVMVMRRLRLVPPRDLEDAREGALDRRLPTLCLTICHRPLNGLDDPSLPAKHQVSKDRLLVAGCCHAVVVLSCRIDRPHLTAGVTVA